ncbi:MAG: dimethyladenosine transferase, rRNA (adenine1518-N6/adenine1519-N6)-dimethyltransferase [Candidatus Parcubacteria bacterium]|jgi:16S rRNA (adenine1518-N6/adenine1519-N6)-dimethyltransferase
MINIFAKKSLGQNFLHSKPTVEKIVEAGEVTRTDTVLEIGPGTGFLTEALLLKAGKVIAVEKDDRLIAPLKEKFSKEIADGRLILIHGDALTLNPEIFLGTLKSRVIRGASEACDQDVQKYVAGANEGSNKEVHRLQGSYKLIANIPYYITGQFFRRFLSEVAQPNTLVALIQKEVADRIVAVDGKESLLSLSVKTYGTPRRVAVVGRGCFTPAPNVDSAIIAITNISKDFFNSSPKQEELFFELIRAGFAHKRKMLLGNFKTTEHRQETLDLKNIDFEKIFKTLNIPKDIRAEDLTLDEWKRIVKSLTPKKV